MRYPILAQWAVRPCNSTTTTILSRRLPDLMSTLRQCLLRPLRHRVVFLAAAAKVVDAAGEEFSAPGGADMAEIFQHRGAELVIVGVAAFQEDQQAGFLDEVLRVLVGLGVCQRQPGGLHLVLAN